MAMNTIPRVDVARVEGDLKEQAMHGDANVVRRMDGSV